MRVALTLWEDRISPVFDAARTLLVATIENARIRKSETISFNPKVPLELVDTLLRREITVLICGAISELPANTLDAEGIHLIPFITGNAMEVIETFARGNPIRPAYAMPGCGDHCPRKKQ